MAQPAFNLQGHRSAVFSKWYGCKEFYPENGCKYNVVVHEVVVRLIPWLHDDVFEEFFHDLQNLYAHNLLFRGYLFLLQSVIFSQHFTSLPYNNSFWYSASDAYHRLSLSVLRASSSRSLHGKSVAVFQGSLLTHTGVRTLRARSTSIVGVQEQYQLDLRQ